MVNFVSHPVILGFMNAAAVIIALSQLDMLLGIQKGRSDSFLYDIWEMLAYLPETDLPTLAMSAFSLALMLGLKRIPGLSKLSVLIAVAVTILVSAAVDFEHKTKANPEHIADAAAREAVKAYAAADARFADLSAEIGTLSKNLRRATRANDGRAAADLAHEIEVRQLARLPQLNGLGERN